MITLFTPSTFQDFEYQDKQGNFLSVVLYWCETHSILLCGENVNYASENKMLNK